MISDKLKRHIAFSLKYMFTRTDGGKKVKDCSACINKMLKLLETDNEPFIKYFCNEVVRKRSVKYELVYEFAKTNWKQLLNSQLNNLN